MLIELLHRLLHVPHLLLHALHLLLYVPHLHILLNLLDLLDLLDLPVHLLLHLLHLLPQLSPDLLHLHRQGWLQLDEPRRRWCALLTISSINRCGSGFCARRCACGRAVSTERHGVGGD